MPFSLYLVFDLLHWAYSSIPIAFVQWLHRFTPAATAIAPQHTQLPSSPLLDLTPWAGCCHPSLWMPSLPSWNSNSPHLTSSSHLSPTPHGPSFYCPLPNMWIHSPFLPGFNTLLWAITTTVPLPHADSDIPHHTEGISSSPNLWNHTLSCFAPTETYLAWNHLMAFGMNFAETKGGKEGGREEGLLSVRG